MADRYGTQLRASAQHGLPLLTTGDAARLLGLTMNGVRWLERTHQLECERTLSGRRLFPLRAVEDLVVARARRRHRQLAMIRPRMARAQLRLPLGRRP